MAHTAKINELHEQRGNLIANARAIIEEHGDTIPEDKAKQADEMLAESQSLREQIDALEQEDKAQAERVALLAQEQDDLERVRRTPELQNRLVSSGQLDLNESRNRELPTRSINDSVNLAIHGWATGSRSPEFQQALKDTGCTIAKGELTIPLASQPMFRWDGRSIKNALTVTRDTTGGELVPEGFLPELERALLEFGGVRRVCRILRTASGNSLDIPETNDTSNKGSLLAINVQDSEQDVAFATTTLDAYKYTSKIVRVPVELEQDSAFNVSTMLGSMLGERLARIENEHATTGTGSSQPNGIVTASALGDTAAATGTVTADEVIDLFHSVDPAYRGSGSGWMFNDSMLAIIRKLKGSDNNYLWQPGLAADTPDLLLSRPYTINQDMASAAASAKTMLFGQFMKYICREVMSVTLRRLTERYADYHQVGYVAIMRFDADLLDAGTNPVKHMIQAAS